MPSRREGECNERDHRGDEHRAEVDAAGLVAKLAGGSLVFDWQFASVHVADAARGERDARALALVLTPDGLALARTCAARARALNERFFAGADPGLYETLMGLAGRRAENP